MDFNSTIDLIIRELEEAREIIDDLKKYQGVPALQVELAKSKCKSAADVIVLLKNIQAPVPLNTEKMAEHAVHTDEAQFSDKSASPIAPAIDVKTENTEMRTKPEPEIRSKEKDKFIEKESFTQQQPKKPFVAPIIADSFSHLANRFNEQVGTKEDELSNMMNRKQYKNLTDAIGVNDRFYFIREIFNGDKEAYSEAISKLEKAEDLSQAKVVIMNYKSDKSENEAVKQLLDLVKRKFKVDE